MRKGIFSDPRFLHTKGKIKLCVNRAESTDQGSFISLGIDGDLWLWNNENLDYAEYSPWKIGERTYGAVAWHDDNVYVGSVVRSNDSRIERYEIRKFSIADQFTDSTFIANVDLEVISLDVSKSGNYLASGSCDQDVNAFSLKSGITTTHTVHGSVLSVAFDSTEKFLAAADSDGSLTVLEMNACRFKHDTITMKLFQKPVWTKPEESCYQLCWANNSGRIFAPVFGGFKEILIESITDYDVKDRVLGDAWSYETFTVCAITKCDSYLAIAGSRGVILVWNVESKSVVSKSDYMKNESVRTISSLIWHPKIPYTIFVADTQENIRALSDVVDADTDISSHGELVHQPDNEHSNDSIESVDLGAIKKLYEFSPKYEPVVTTSKPRLGAETVVNYKPPRIPFPFVVASAPEMLNHRFMKWNMYGIVTCSSSKDDKSLDARWHDSSVSSMIVWNNVSYQFADISNSALVVASRETALGQSEVRVYITKTNGLTGRSWSMRLPPGESVENVALGSDFIALYTSLRFIRLITLGGNQRIVFSHQGPLITMSAHKSSMVTVGVDGGCYFENAEPQFNLVANVYDKVDLVNWYSSERQVKRYPISLSGCASLRWIGFSANGSLYTMDTENIVRLLTLNGLWIPVHKFKPKPGVFIFMIGVADRSGTSETTMRYLTCEGSDYPLVEYPPVQQAVKFDLPLCNEGTEKTDLEKAMLLSELNTSQGKTLDRLERTTKERTLASMFAIALKSDLEYRAAELGVYTRDMRTIRFMSTLAEKSRSASALLAIISKVADQLLPTLDQNPEPMEEENKKPSGSLAPVKIKRKIADEMRSGMWKCGRVEESEDASNNANEKRSDGIQLNGQSQTSELLSTSLSTVAPISEPRNPFKMKADNTKKPSLKKLFLDSMQSTSSR